MVDDKIPFAAAFPQPQQPDFGAPVQEAPPRRRGRPKQADRKAAPEPAKRPRKARAAKAGAKAGRETTYAPTERALAVIAELGIKPDDVAVLSEAMILIGKAPKKARGRVAAALARIFA